ncbi:hypothetical protein PMAYCL1PPCAC_22533 [Pristionchus mayeri]|uniref:Uncharacterized protein n=1 Tax=Pristionchus mayeri TaxID=1317129 RepID=A0AAN5CWN5_9BILA|nr:hypothetical protein PMAYCL1PPCAC_22533 [Pristionchus mayeri]
MKWPTIHRCYRSLPTTVIFAAAEGSTTTHPSLEPPPLPRARPPPASAPVWLRTAATPLPPSPPEWGRLTGRPPSTTSRRRV